MSLSTDTSSIGTTQKKQEIVLPCGRSPAGKALISWLSFAMSNCDVVTFQLVSWVRCGA